MRALDIRLTPNARRARIGFGAVVRSANRTFVLLRRIFYAPSALDLFLRKPRARGAINISPLRGFSASSRGRGKATLHEWRTCGRNRDLLFPLAWRLFKIRLLFAALLEIFSVFVIFPGCELPVLISLCWSPVISTNGPFSFRFF